MPMTPGTEELTELEQLAIDAATEAGRFIVDDRPAELAVAKTKSSATDVVTVMDQQAEQLLRRRITAARPHDAIVGEEAAATDGSSGVTWLIDPIDGTVNYLYGIPAYCVSVAAVTGDASSPGGWRPVAAAVCNPNTGEVFHARLGGGARRVGGRGTPPEGLPVGVSGVTTLGQALTGTGFGYLSEVRARQGAVAAALLPHIRDLRRAGSAALDLCAVASGHLDAYFESGLNPWDLAAGWLIASEAGALVTGLRSAGPAGEMTGAAGPGVHAQLLKRLEELIPAC
jgi:myo-inositol-1(or 4)-monophosphatase